MERQPQTRTSRIPRGLRYPLYSAVTAFAVAAAACSGSEKGATNPPGSNPNGENHVPTATVRLEPTATSTVEPTATETPFVPQRLFDAPFEPTTIDQIHASIEAAYQAHPDANDFRSQEGLEYTRDVVNTITENCELGFPEDRSSSGLVLASRVAQCSSLITIFNRIYQEKSYAEFFDAAANVHNYAITDLPSAQIDQIREILTSRGIQ